MMPGNPRLKAVFGHRGSQYIDLRLKNSDGTQEPFLHIALPKRVDRQGSKRAGLHREFGFAFGLWLFTTSFIYHL